MEWFLKCVKEHYFDFNGRARRKEYWMFTLVNIIISVALSVVLGLISEKLWGGGSFGAGEWVASDGWRPDVARV